MKSLLKRTLLVLLALVLVCSCGCTKKKTDNGNKSTVSGTSSDTKDPVNDWELPVDGDTTSSDNAQTVPTVKPTGDNKFADTVKPIDKKTDPPSDYPDYSKMYGMSSLADTKSLQFFYKGFTYAYGITKNGTERIALIDQNNGDWIDLINGAGTMKLVSTSGTTLLESKGISRFETTVIDGFTTLYVYYELSGVSAAKAELVTEYTFRKNSIGISQRVTCNSNFTVSASKSILARQIIQTYESVDKDVIGKWRYPENGDYPYIINESIATGINFDKHHTLYTFVTSVKEDTTIFRDSYPDYNIPLDFNDTKGINYTCTMELVMATQTGDDTEDSYRAMFSGRGSNYAVGIFPETPNSENSTIFVGNSVDLNLNMTNLVDNDFRFSLRYDIRDYYGNIVDSGIFIDNTCYAGTTMDRKIHVSGKYGMYYLNLYTISRYYTHLECYPFALIPSDNYPNRATNPFGLTSIEGHNVLDEYLTAGSIVIKTGAGNYRMSNQSDGQYVAVREMHKAGVGINVQINTSNIDNDYLSKIDSFKESLTGTIEKVKDFADSIEIGNEIDGLATIIGSHKLEELIPKYINGTLIPASEVVRGAGFKYANAGSAGCSTIWFNALGDSGAWNSFDILSSHSYGIPVVPDKISATSDLWNFEMGCVRSYNAMQKYGFKEWYLSETGYCTVPKSPQQVSLRTQADYNMRILIIGHSYGASRVQLFSFYDRMSYGLGYHNDEMEMGYGICYQPDFLGIVKPKPTTAAFAAINHITDGLVKTEEYAKYTTSTLRTFKLTKNNGKTMYAAWSNAYPLPNALRTRMGDRLIGMPWQSEYKKSETVTYTATGNKVIVTDIMGNSQVYTPVGGKVQIQVTGSPIFIEGIE